MAKWASSGGMLTGRPPVSDMVDRANCVGLEESAPQQDIVSIECYNKLQIKRSFFFYDERGVDRRLLYWTTVRFSFN